MKASIVSALGLVAAASAWNQSTTSTVYTTSVYTVTSCAPTVTDCPAKIGKVTTDIISLYTTICPVTETEKTSSAPMTTYTPWTTSTVYSTKEYTITSCPPEVTNCPVGSKTTTVITSTTSCPITTATSAPYTVIPPPVSVSSSAPYTVVPPPISLSTSSAPYTVVPPPVSASSSPVLSTITISTCVPSYYTSVITVTGTPASKTWVSTGTGAPVPPKNTTTPYVPVTGGAGAVKVGGAMAIVGLVAALL
ncbi:uncharacterized protein LY89DRAFT_671841 [Mollisia scopiformis]|uniref:Uncharacterized protein n=1 Tax=Mollisia scopiformis TaxID=149040 RepID=A0A194X2U5_MOLSC|nr:uncharacterized protein LY89DRAFT_671841 [Mollisia scopiformis]KUJ14503.1 hypothetical protein LY89DRAFT_671841 [Mollisia scopiformis]